MDKGTGVARTGSAPGYWPAAAHGVLLGAIGVLIVCALFFLFGVLEFLLGFFERFSPGERLSAILPEAMILSIALLMSFVIFLFTIAPASIGGAINALMLFALARSGKLTIRLGLLIGAFSGLIWGIVVSRMAEAFIEGSSYVWDKESAGILLGVPTLVGIWHGWRMARFLQKHGCGGIAAISQKHENSTSINHR